MNIETFDNFLRKTTANRLLLITVIGCVSLWAVYYFGFGGISDATAPVQSQSTSVSTESQPDATEPKPDIRPSQSPSNASSDSEAHALESRVLGLRGSDVQDTVDDLLSAIGSFTDAYEDWQNLMRELPDDETGRILARDTESLPRIIEAIELGKASGDAYPGIESRASEVAEELSEFLKANPRGQITPATETVVSDLKKKITSNTDQMELALSEIRRLIARSEGESPGSVTLRQAIGDYKRLEKQREIDAAVAAREAVREENAQKLLEAEKERQAAEQKAKELKLARETERLKAEAEAAEAEAEAERIASEAKRQRVKLEGEFERDRSKIQRYLGPLFIETTKQPGGTTLVETRESKPVSLSALQSVGLSNPDVSKACSSLLLFFSYFEAGGRGHGPYPTRYYGGNLTQEELAAIRPAYDLLNKYGDLLVEKEMLAP